MSVAKQSYLKFSFLQTASHSYRFTVKLSSMKSNNSKVLLSNTLHKESKQIHDSRAKLRGLLEGWGPGGAEVNPGVSDSGHSLVWYLL